jgi:hypothetical protein
LRPLFCASKQEQLPAAKESRPSCGGSITASTPLQSPDKTLQSSGKYLAFSGKRHFLASRELTAPHKTFLKKRTTAQHVNINPFPAKQDLTSSRRLSANNHSFVLRNGPALRLPWLATRFDFFGALLFSAPLWLLGGNWRVQCKPPEC